MAASRDVVVVLVKEFPASSGPLVVPEVYKPVELYSCGYW